MSIIVKEGGTSYPPHEPGQHAAACIDVMDFGMVETQYGKKHRVAVRFFCGQWHETDEGTVPLFVDAFFNATLGEGSRLRDFTESWRGQAFTQTELDGFDLELLIGANALLQVVHNATPKRTYANIQTVMRLPNGTAAPDPPPDYVRLKDRPTEDDGAPVDATPTGDDLPF